MKTIFWQNSELSIKSWERKVFVLGRVQATSLTLVSPSVLFRSSNFPNNKSSPELMRSRQLFVWMRHIPFVYAMVLHVTLDPFSLHVTHKRKKSNKFPPCLNGNTYFVACQRFAYAHPNKQTSPPHHDLPRLNSYLNKNFFHEQRFIKHDWCFNAEKAKEQVIFKDILKL